jgi:hypothetical protein
MESEASKTKKTNDWFGLNQENTPKLTEDQLILCHTMYKSKQFAEFKDKMVLIDGASKDDIGLA